MCDLEYGYMGFAQNINKIKGKTIQYDDMSIESACENENNVLLLNSFSSNIYTQGDVHVKGTNSYMNVKKQINVKPNTTYVVSVNIESINKGDNNYSPRLQIKKGSTIICSTNSSSTFNSGDNTTLDISMYVNNGTPSTTECEANFKNIKVQELNEIQLPQPLRSLPNGVCDEVVGNKLIQRVGKIIVDGTNNIVINSIRENTVRFFITDSTIKNVKSGDLPFLCDTLPKSNIIWGNDTEGIYQDKYDNKFVASVSKSKLNGVTLNDIKSYFVANPMTLYYEVATYIEHTIDININKIKKSKCYNKIKPTII